MFALDDENVANSITLECGPVEKTQQLRANAALTELGSGLRTHMLAHKASVSPVRANLVPSAGYYGHYM